jgi:hypothetical protein
VAETVPAGWDLTSATCSDGSAPASIGLAAGETVTCTFNNRQDASLTVYKHTVPAGDGTLFEFISSFGPFTLGDGQSIPFINIDPGTYSVGENNLPALWDLISAICSDGSLIGAINLSPGEHVDCHLTNRRRGDVTLLKTESGGLPLSHPYTFEIREGASELAAGTILANGSADVDTGEVVFTCAGVPLADCVDYLGVARFPPGDYQLCETGMMPGWSNTLDGFTPLGATPEGGDNSTECVNFTLDAGETEDFGTIDNIPPPGGDARTIGFWKNWSSCDGGGNQDPVLDETLGDGIFLWGDEILGFLVDSCPEAVDLLDKRRIANPDVVGDGAKVAGDAAYNMSAQLLAVLLNFEAEAGSCPAIVSAVNDAQALLARIGFTGGATGDANQSYLPSNVGKSDLLGDPDPAGGNFTKPKLLVIRADAEALNGILDAYNNNELCP